MNWQSIGSVHARARARQRGICNQVIALVLTHADRETPVGGRCIAITLSRKMAQRLIGQGTEPELAERGTRLALVVGSSGRIVTVLRQLGSQGRRYRRR